MRRRRFEPALRLAAALVLLVLSISAGAEVLPIRAYSTVDGLPHRRVKRIRADTLGFLWFCTTEGLGRFDGRTFTTRHYSHSQATGAVVTSYYWHFVDVVWIALFATIYLLK